MEVIGWAGTALVIVGYYPQIHHLLVKRCAWGLSISTWVIWLIASTLLLIHCILGRDYLFMVVQSINLIAIAITIIVARKSNNICPHHLAVVQTAVRQ